MVLLVCIFVIHVLGLMHTENYNYAIADLRIKLPFLALPVIIAGMPPIKKSGFHFVMKVFLLAVFTSTILSYINILKTKPTDLRDGILFVSHIRLGLMIVLGMSYAMFSWNRESLFWRIVYLIFIIWALLFMWSTASMTGLGILSVVLLYILLLKLKRSKFKKPLLLLLVIGGIGFTWFFIDAYQQYFTPKEELLNAPTHSELGESYTSIKEDTQLENGYYINHFIAPKELEEGWNTKSDIAIDARDKMGQPIRSTLIRYMTSKGLKKDLNGISALSLQDISNIENGMTNATLLDQTGFSKRLNALFFEWNAYRNGANPSSNSVMMRAEFWRAGINVIENHILFGVGTGDIKDELDSEYERSDSILDQPYRKRVHNQYLAFAISFGIIGLALILLCFLYPYFTGYGNRFAYVFLIIFLLSFITEDTLETQAGATFVAFFSCLFIQLFPRN